MAWHAHVEALPSLTPFAVFVQAVDLFSSLTLSAETAAALLPLLEHLDWCVRSSALKALAWHPAEILSLFSQDITRLLGSPDWGVRKVALRTRRWGLPRTRTSAVVRCRIDRRESDSHSAS